MNFFYFVFCLVSYSYKLFIYMRNFILHILTKVKFYPYIYALIFQFVFIILIFLAFISLANTLQMLNFS